MDVVSLRPVRVDKWLWAARFFKTRSAAAEAADGGKVHVNGQPAKPSRLVKPGDTLSITSEAGLYTVELLIPAEDRVSAALAQAYYTESNESRDLRAKAAEARRTMLASEPGFTRTKPSKRDRRLIHSFSGKD